ncbi:MAG: DUF1902 domain-containing protein [Pseudomonadota bacterium]
MANRTFFVRAHRDSDAGVWYSESDIKGLVIEAETLEEFEQILMELGPDMILENHTKPEDYARLSLRDLVPAILWQKPETSVV